MPTSRPPNRGMQPEEWARRVRDLERRGFVRARQTCPTCRGRAAEPELLINRHAWRAAVAGRGDVPPDTLIIVMRYAESPTAPGEPVTVFARDLPIAQDQDGVARVAIDMAWRCRGCNREHHIRETDVMQALGLK